MTNHLTENDLILHYYGETPDEVEPHLAECAECRDEYRRLQLVLNTVDLPVPERTADYEQRVWAQLEPKIGIRRRTAWFSPRRWAPAVAMSALLVTAYFAGRNSRPEAPAPQTASAPQVRERLLVVGVSEHLERSQMVLVEILNQSGASGNVDISAERDLAGSLVKSNRIYRQTAVTAGEPGVAGVLDDLERVLLEIAHSPEKMTADQLESIRNRIEAEGLLFKVRVVGSRMGEEKNRPIQNSSVTKI